MTWIRFQTVILCRIPSSTYRIVYPPKPRLRPNQLLTREKKTVQGKEGKAKTASLQLSWSPWALADSNGCPHGDSTEGRWVGKRSHRRQAGRQKPHKTRPDQLPREGSDTDPSPLQNPDTPSATQTLFQGAATQVGLSEHATPGGTTLFLATTAEWRWPELPLWSLCEVQGTKERVQDTCTVDPWTNPPSGDCLAQPNGLGGDSRTPQPCCTQPGGEQIYCRYSHKSKSWLVTLTLRDHSAEHSRRREVRTSLWDRRSASTLSEPEIWTADREISRRLTQMNDLPDFEVPSHPVQVMHDSNAVCLNKDVWATQPPLEFLQS